MKAKAKQRVEIQRLANQGVIARRDIDPADALIELVQWTAGEVDYWRGIVSAISDGDLTWGVTKIKEGGDDRGTTQEAKPHIAYVMLERASDRLVTYAAAALRAGVDERRVRMAERQGSLVAGVIRAILGRLELSAAQQVLVGTVVPEELRALGRETRA